VPNVEPCAAFSRESVDPEQAILETGIRCDRPGNAGGQGQMIGVARAYDDAKMQAGHAVQAYKMPAIERDHRSLLGDRKR